MTAATQTVSAGPSLWRRLYGLGSIFGKAMRDSRRAMILAGALLAIIFLGVTKAFVAEFDTADKRLELVQLTQGLPPIIAGLAGKITDNVGTMGGYLQYKYGTFIPMLLSLWSILALSGTLASETQRGSMDILAATGKSRRTIALQKLGGHLVPLSIALLILFLSIAIAGSAYPVLPGDEISVTSAFAYTVWAGLMALAAGSLAFALGPFIGRGAAAGIAGFVTFAGFILNGYQAPIPSLAPFASLTWWGWTSNHLALAGYYDWRSVGLVAALVAVLLYIGVAAFSRRDLGTTSTVPTPSMPRALRGLGGPVSRSAAGSLPAALAWGAGLGLFGLVLGNTSRDFLEQLQKSPMFLQLLQQAFPNHDYASPGGFLQLLFVQFGVLLAGLAAATFVAGWASDETSGRLEMVLATPLSRVRWALASGAGLLIGVGVFVALVAVGVGVGLASAGGDLATPVLGSLILGVYAAALVGIGLAVGGLSRTSWAAPAVVIVVLMTWLMQLIGPLLHLPEAVQNLALTAHLGQTMVGEWDLGGLAIAAVLAIGGIALGAWGFRRRDLIR
jgi:ABC-2 type transport system permease protein